MTFKTSTVGPEGTAKLGYRIGGLLRGGEVLDLIGDLGAGKTTLIKGVLSGLGYKGDVPSPTYTISRVYRLNNNLEFHHFDFYRISGSDVVVSELAEIMGRGNVIIALEWAENIKMSLLPSGRTKVMIEHQGSDTGRKITIRSALKKYSYITKGLA